MPMAAIAARKAKAVRLDQRIADAGRRCARAKAQKSLEDAELQTERLLEAAANRIARWWAGDAGPNPTLSAAAKALSGDGGLSFVRFTLTG